MLMDLLVRFSNAVARDHKGMPGNIPLHAVFHLHLRFYTLYANNAENCHQVIIITGWVISIIQQSKALINSLQLIRTNHNTENSMLDSLQIYSVSF